MSTIVGKGVMAVDPDVGPVEPSGIDWQIESLALKAQEAIGREQVVKAKEEFYARTGKFHPEDEFYHARINYFLDNLLFETSLPLDHGRLFKGKAVFEHFAEAARPGDPQLAVARVRHAVFQIEKIKNGKLLVQDLLAKEPFVVSQRPGQSFEGLARKQVFQGFLYFTDDACYLSKGIFFHPASALGILRKYLKKKLKAEGFDEKETLSHLARLHMRHLRHPHVDPKNIYAEPKK